MRNFEKESLPSPQEFIEEISREENSHFILSMLRRAYIVVDNFPCNVWESDEIWDTGFCLGYIIYAASDDVVFLENCENILSSLSNNFAKKYYDTSDLRPFGIVMVLDCNQIYDAKIVNQIAFLESCYAKGFS